MKVSAYIRKNPQKKNTDEKATIYFRVRDGVKDFKIASELKINPNHWSPAKYGYKDRVALVTDEDKYTLNRQVKEIIDLIHQNYSSDADAEWLSDVIYLYHHPTKDSATTDDVKIVQSFQEIFNEFLSKRKLSEVRKKNFRVLLRCLQRYELYIRSTVSGKSGYKLDVKTIDSNTLQDIWDYLENENSYVDKYPFIFENIKEKRPLKGRGKNTIIDYFSKLRTFLLWCYSEGKTSARPFDSFKIEDCTYGSPVYITIEERDKLFYHDFSIYPEIEVQRDIFVFQSLIGCRVSDLYSFTVDSVINDVIEYILRKTKDGRPVTVRVPLNPIAKHIITKYKDEKRNELLPFTYEQEYNNYIKVALKMAGITRKVTVLDPKTGQEIKRHIYEIASSHMARRNFIGNLYKKVQDPNLIGALSGHKEGSKAFARYREIDDQIKKEIISLL